MWKPSQTDNSTVSPPPIVENRPFMLQAHAIAPRGFDASSSMPRGNGIPMKKAIGKIIAAAASTRVAVGSAMKCPEMRG